MESKFKKLFKGKNYGTNCKNIYLDCCHSLNFDSTKQNKFGRWTPCFAHKADTDRTRDVWFIGHSNLTDSAAESGKHLNKVIEDKIYEYFSDAADDIYPLNDRLVFVKEKHGGYVFYGIYRPANPLSKEQGRIYNRISNIYPIQE